ncbi:FCD domain-containing protein [Sinorhizobium meliloti]|nr:FCD domain-containing protein [Sinorhizobium meliloti]
MSGPEAEQRVVQVIVEAIMHHRVAPGARLIERELAIASGASRSAIRNGLMRLAHAGLVELSPNKGASIAMCSPDEARQIFDARIVIETATVEKLAGTIGETERARLRSFVEDERNAYEEGRMEEARHLSRRFHLLLAEMAGNDVLTGVIRDLINRQPLLSWSRPDTEPRFCGNHAHSEIVEAAARLNMEHLRALERELVADRAAAMQAFRSVQANAASGESAQREDGDAGID